jgi:hypothetical protein
MQPPSDNPVSSSAAATATARVPFLVRLNMVVILVSQAARLPNQYGDGETRPVSNCNHRAI